MFLSNFLKFLAPPPFQNPAYATTCKYCNFDVEADPGSGKVCLQAEAAVQQNKREVETVSVTTNFTQRWKRKEKISRGENRIGPGSTTSKKELKVEAIKIEQL